MQTIFLLIIPVAVLRIIFNSNTIILSVYTFRIYGVMDIW